MSRSSTRRGGRRSGESRTPARDVRRKNDMHHTVATRSNRDEGRSMYSSSPPETVCLPTPLSGISDPPFQAFIQMFSLPDAFDVIGYDSGLVVVDDEVSVRRAPLGLEPSYSVVRRELPSNSVSSGFTRSGGESIKMSTSLSGSSSTALFTAFRRTPM